MSLYSQWGGGGGVASMSLYSQWGGGGGGGGGVARTYVFALIVSKLCSLQSNISAEMSSHHQKWQTHTQKIA